MMFILCWFLGAQISSKSYKMFEKLSQSGKKYLYENESNQSELTLIEQRLDISL